MQHYFQFIAEWAGTGFLAPVMFMFALAGPFALLLLAGESRGDSPHGAALAVAACSLVAYFFVCLGTGIYLGKFHGLGGWGIPLGFVLFASSVLVVVWIQEVVRKLRRKGSAMERRP